MNRIEPLAKRARHDTGQYNSPHPHSIHMVRAYGLILIYDRLLLASAARGPAVVVAANNSAIVARTDYDVMNHGVHDAQNTKIQITDLLQAVVYM